MEYESEILERKPEKGEMVDPKTQSINLTELGPLIVDIYPKDFLQNIKKGKRWELTKLLQQGIVWSFTFFKQGRASEFWREICSNTKLHSPPMVVCDLDEEQDKFNLICDVVANTNCSKSILDYFLFSIPIINSLYEDNGLYNTITIISNIDDESFLYEILYISTKKSLLEYPTFSSIEASDKKRKLKLISKSTKKTKPKNKRTIFTKSIRHEVFKKCNHKCIECGATKEISTLHIDHIVPISRNGTDELSNLQILCQDCNLAKKNRIYEKVNLLESEPLQSEDEKNVKSEVVIS
jgi:5-methylcytosine-specific restriction endonuclease McrA